MHHLLAVYIFLKLGVFLFDGFRCWCGWAFSNSSVYLPFWQKMFWTNHARSVPWCPPDLRDEPAGKAHFVRILVVVVSNRPPPTIPEPLRPRFLQTLILTRQCFVVTCAPIKLQPLVSKKNLCALTQNHQQARNVHSVFPLGVSVQSGFVASDDSFFVYHSQIFLLTGKKAS